MDQTLKGLRSTLSFFLSESILNLFPTAWLVDTQVSDTQFSCKFYSDQPAHPQLLDLLEENLRGILKSNPGLKEIEMTKRSALEYFLHKEQPLLVEKLEQEEVSTFKLLRHNSFFNFYTFPPLLEGFESSVIQLFEERTFEKVDGKYLIEISGTAFFNKEDLKSFVKHRKLWMREKPQLELERLGWGKFTSEGITLLPKGIDVYLMIQTLWRQQIRKNPQVIEIMGEDVPAKSLGVARWGEQDLSHFKVPLSELRTFCISSLQFIEETFMMMELNVEWVLCMQSPSHLQTKQWKQEVKCLTEALQICSWSYSIDPGKSHEDHPAIEIRVTDKLGEQWAGPFLRIDLRGDPTKSGKSHSVADIEYSLLGSIKHLIALLAEIKQGILPKSLQKGS